MPTRQLLSRQRVLRGQAASSGIEGSGRLTTAVRTALEDLIGATERLLEDPCPPHRHPEQAERSPLARLRSPKLRRLYGTLDIINQFSITCTEEAASAILALRGDSARLALIRAALAALHATKSDLGTSGTQPSLLHVFAYGVQSVGRILYHANKQEPLVHSFVRQLLRAQALHAASRQLADFIEALPAPDESGQGGQQGRRQPLSARVTQVAEAVAATVRFVGMLLVAGCKCCDNLDDSEQVLTALELAAALFDSGALEHAARALMLLVPLRAGSDLPSRTNHRSHTESAAYFFVSAALRLQQLQAASLDAGEDTAAAQLAHALSGRCVQTAVLSLGVASLCAADGGTAYGMPPTLLDAMPVDMSSEPPRQLGTTAMGAMVGLLSLKARARPPGRRGALLLALRIVRLAVASAQADQAQAAEASPSCSGSRHGRSRVDRVCAGGSGSSGGKASARASAGGAHDGSARNFAGGSSDYGSRSSCGGGVAYGNDSDGAGSLDSAPAAACCTPLRMLVVEGGVFELCVHALESARQLRQSHPQPSSAQWRAEAVEWWRLAAAATRHTLRRSSPMYHGNFACALHPLLPEVEEETDRAAGTWQLPLAPPPEVSAALEAGFLPCLERLLRRAGQDPGGPEAGVVRGLLGRDVESMMRLLAPLLAYGDPRQAAALVATLGKLLRLTDPRVVMAPLWAPHEDTQQSFVHAAYVVLGSASPAPGQQSPERPSAASQHRAPVPPDGAAAMHPQLACMLSYAASEWLPPLSRLALRGMQQEVQQAEQGGAGGLDRWLSIDVALLPVANWLPFLALGQCLDSKPGSSAAPPSSGAGYAGGGADRANGGWASVGGGAGGSRVQGGDGVGVRGDGGGVGGDGGGVGGDGGGVSGDGTGVRGETPEDGSGSGSGCAAGGICTDAAPGSAAGLESAAGGGSGTAGAACATAGTGAGASDWRSTLLEEVGAVPLLGAALRMAASVDGDTTEDEMDILQGILVGCEAVAGFPGAAVATSAMPEAEAEAVRAGPSTPVLAAGPMPGARAGSPGAKTPQGNVAAAAALSGALQPELLRAVAARLRAGGDGESADTAAALADWLERGRGAGGGGEAGGAPGPVPTTREEGSRVLMASWEMLARALPPPGEARRLLRTCGNPGCANLAGDSEAELTLRGCSGCRAVSYCCRECQAAHWRAGHREACKGRSDHG